MSDNLLQLRDAGIFCPAGDFYVDPWRPVDRAVLTHAHADHARPGCTRYVAAADGIGLLRSRLGPDIAIAPLAYGEALHVNGVRVSLHPAGHVLGSAQVRIEHRGEISVVSGDYKTAPDPTCAAFEPVRCHTYITESTFGLPIYRWPDPSGVFDAINAWWRGNREAGKASLLYAYSLGKAQRLLAGVEAGIGPIFTHGAVEKMTAEYRLAGVALPPTTYVGAAPPETDWSRALIVAPPAAHGTPWARKFGASSSGFASGWMRLRGARRRRAVDRGFVLSDHADWQGLWDAIRATGADRVWVTHGNAAIYVRWLREQGLEAEALSTRFEGDDEGEPRIDTEEHG